MMAEVLSWLLIASHISCAWMCSTQPQRSRFYPLYIHVFSHWSLHTAELYCQFHAAIACAHIGEINYSILSSAVTRQIFILEYFLKPLAKKKKLCNYSHLESSVSKLVHRVICYLVIYLPEIWVLIFMWPPITNDAESLAMFSAQHIS